MGTRRYRLSRNQAGFTIIESMLFLAISSGLIIVALTGLDGRNEQVRFTQSMRSLESFMQTQQNLVQTGAKLSDVSGSSCNNPAAQKCVMLGRVVEFNPNSSDINIYTMLGSLYDPSTLGSGEPELNETLYQAQPQVAQGGAGVAVEQATIDWGGIFTQGQNSASPTATSDVRLFGYLRAPNGTQIVPISFNHDGSADMAAFLDDQCHYAVLPGETPCAQVRSTIQTVFNAEACITNPSRDKFARLVLGESNRPNAISVEYNQEGSCA